MFQSFVISYVIFDFIKNSLFYVIIPIGLFFTGVSNRSGRVGSGYPTLRNEYVAWFGSDQVEL